MQRELVLFVTTTPYSTENTHTIIRLARAALKKGHSVRLVASGDGVFSVVRGKVPESMKALEELVSMGMKVDI